MKTENQAKAWPLGSSPDIEEDELRPFNIAISKSDEGVYDFNYTRRNMQSLIDHETLIQITIDPKVKNSDVLRELQNMIDIISEVLKKTNCKCFCCL